MKGFNIYDRLDKEIIGACWIPKVYKLSNYANNSFDLFFSIITYARLLWQVLSISLVISSVILSNNFIYEIIASWQWYDRSKLAKPENMDFRKVTRVNFAFFQVCTNS